MTEEKIDELHKGLIEMYNEGKERVVASAFVERKPGQTQDTGVQNTIRLLMTKAPLEYEFIMIWRYDMVMTLSLDESVAVPKKKENQFKQWRQWVKKVKEELFWFAGTQIFLAVLCDVCCELSWPMFACPKTTGGMRFLATTRIARSRPSCTSA